MPNDVILCVSIHELLVTELWVKMSHFFPVVILQFPMVFYQRGLKLFDLRKHVSSICYGQIHLKNLKKKHLRSHALKSPWIVYVHMNVRLCVLEKFSRLLLMYFLKLILLQSYHIILCYLSSLVLFFFFLPKRLHVDIKQKKKKSSIKTRPYINSSTILQIYFI